MTYKEYISLRKKYMGDNNTSEIHNNTVNYRENEEEKKNYMFEERINKIRSKSKNEKIRSKTKNEEDSKVKEMSNKYDTNLDENGNEVLNENLFKNRQIEYKKMRKTFTGKFLSNKVISNNNNAKNHNIKRDKKVETAYNFNNRANKAIGLDFNKQACKSYYGGFRKRK